MICQPSVWKSSLDLSACRATNTARARMPGGLIRFAQPRILGLRSFVTSFLIFHLRQDYEEKPLGKYARLVGNTSVARIDMNTECPKGERSESNGGDPLAGRRPGAPHIWVDFQTTYYPAHITSEAQKSRRQWNVTKGPRQA